MLISVGHVGVLSPWLLFGAKPGQSAAEEKNNPSEVPSKDQAAGDVSGAPSGPPDAKWVRLAQKGDRQAYRHLVEKYERRVYSVVFGMLHNREDALEVTQEAFVKAFGRLDKFAGRSSFYTWIYRIAVNLAIDFRRREWKKSDKAVEYDDTREDGSSIDSEAFTRGEPGPERAHFNKELGGAIQAALDQLPEEQKAVLVMREIEGMSYQEMAETMGCSIGTIMSRLHYARKKMQGMLKEYV